MLIRISDGLITAYFYFYAGLFFLPQRHISNISAPTAGLLFLLLLRYIWAKDSFSGSILIRQLRGISRFSDKKLLFISFVILFTLLSALSIARHLSFSSGASDLGIFAQAIWNTTRGDILFSSLKGNINLLGDHFEPILLFAAPLYKLWPNPIVLLLAQAFLLASAIIPLYLIAKYRLRERIIIFAFIISYILSRPLRGVGLSDFHPECFILPLLFWGYYFLRTRKNLLLSLTVFFLLLCKEDAAFIVSGLGIFALFPAKRPKLGAVLFALGIIAWVIETKAIIPFFNPKGIYPYMDRLPFGLTYAGNIKSVAANPGLLLKLFTDRNKIEYCVKLIGPPGFLSLFSPAHYILIFIPLARNLLPLNQNFSGHYNISSHYAAGIIPFIYISAIYGAGWLGDKIRQRRASFFIGGFIILSSLLFYGKTDGYKLARFLEGIKKYDSFKVISYLRLVPDTASVSANFNLVPHLSNRKYIFEWNPQSEPKAEYIAVDTRLLEYLSKDDLTKVRPYFDNSKNRGYKIFFESPDKAFIILRNPDIDKTPF